ncbi:hypothetical protein TPA0908_33010 [Micromonospora sp. AKA38]|nr:hypothetical protein TPA0908_33010 [Micromonospora sp. AKA38]
MEELLKLQPGSQNGGIYADKPGYHNTRAANSSDNYSVRDAEDKGGPSDKAAAYDWTFPEAQSLALSSLQADPNADKKLPAGITAAASNYSNIARFSNRLLASGQNADDPRLNGWKEFFGQTDNDTTVEGWDFRYHRAASSDSSHLWHIHLSEDRDKVESYDNKQALLSVLRGETVDQWLNRGSSGGVPAGQAVVHEGYTSVFTVNAADGHLQESFLARLGGAWVTQDLSVVAGTPSVAGQPIAVVHDGYTSVFTVNASNGRLQETFLARVGGAWVTQDLGAVAVGQTPSVSVHDGFVSVFTVTSAGQIQETYLSRLGAAWVTQPLPGGVVAPYTSVVTHDGYVSVFAVTTGGRVQETFLASIGVAWVSQDLGVAAVAQAPSVVTHDGYVSVFTVTAAGQLQETYLARMGAAWVTQSLPGSAVKPATSAVVHDGYVSVFAATTGGRLQETFLSGLGTAWVAQDLTADPGTPLMAGRPVTVTHDGYTSVFTINATGGHVQETYLPRIGAAWITQDLTTTAGTPAAKP